MDQHKPCAIQLCRSSAAHLDGLSLQVCLAEYAVQNSVEANQQCFTRFDVVFDGHMGPRFLAELSQPISIGMKGADPSLVQVMTLINIEMLARRCGQPLFINRAGDILRVSLMRHLTARPQPVTGLFFALSDLRLARSLMGIHAKPARPRTLEILANLADMSRTFFVNFF